MTDASRSMSPEVQVAPSSTPSRTVHIRSAYGSDWRVVKSGIADGDGALGEVLLEASAGGVDCLSLLGGALAVLGFDGDDYGAYTDLDVDSAVAGLGGLFFRVKSAFAQLFGKPDVQDGLSGAGGQWRSPEQGTDRARVLGRPF